MITTHLVLFSFLDGASAPETLDGIEGFVSTPPYAFFDGFSEAGAPEPEPEVQALGGVWMAGLRRQRMERLEREAKATTRRKWKKKQRDKRHRQDLAELQQIFTEAAELELTADLADQISAPVARYAVTTFDGRVIPSTLVDWRELARDYAAVRDLTHNLLEIADYVSEDEDLEIAMFMMASMTK